MSEDWLDIYIQQNVDRRLEKVQIVDYGRIRIGKKHFDKQTICDQQQNSI